LQRWKSFCEGERSVEKSVERRVERRVEKVAEDVFGERQRVLLRPGRLEAMEEGVSTLMYYLYMPERWWIACLSRGRLKI
jgi:hypothetical protein